MIRLCYYSLDIVLITDIVNLACACGCGLLQVCARLNREHNYCLLYNQIGKERGEKNNGIDWILFFILQQHNRIALSSLSQAPSWNRWVKLSRTSVEPNQTNERRTRVDDLCYFYLIYNLFTASWFNCFIHKTRVTCCTWVFKQFLSGYFVIRSMACAHFKLDH